MRLLIVDDEVIIRTGLASVIAWHELGIEAAHPLRQRKLGHA